MAPFELDGFRCSYLHVGSFEVDAATVFGNAPEADLAEALARHGLNAASIAFQVRALLVETGSNRVIIDPAGTWEDRHRLEAVLEQAGIDSASIDTVIISHAHGDHFWGGNKADGRPLFPQARYVMQRREWQHWLAADNPEPEHADNFRSALLPIEDRFELIDGAVEIVPGICSRPAFGHSPGQMALEIGTQAIYTGDVLLSPLSVECPRWAASFDVWPEQVVATRMKLLDKLARSEKLVLTCHLPGSGAGHVMSVDEPRWLWSPEGLD